MKIHPLNRDDKRVLFLLILLFASFLFYLFITTSPRSLVASEAGGDSVRWEGERPLLEASTSSLSSSSSSSLQASSKPPKSPSRPIVRDTVPLRTKDYPGPPPRDTTYLPKLKPGATIDLNRADTTLLKRLPGIGSSFARRIVKYRELLGGYYCPEQLQEVYGMDRVRYDGIAPFLRIQTPPRRLPLSPDSIPRHPYLSYKQRSELKRLISSSSALDWTEVMASPLFSRDDSLRLQYYLPIAP